jgi:hypothetical protein
MKEDKIEACTETGPFKIVFCTTWKIKQDRERKQYANPGQLAVPFQTHVPGLGYV